ncbi:MAG TPA: malonyl-CoA decarboxylase [Roseiarcus sp.]|nr:malonyl-CoA decarboxylase [Roseiarcus sp.]
MAEPTTRFEYLTGFWQGVAGRGRALVGMRRPPPLDVEGLIELARKLLGGHGEASGAATAQTLLAGFGGLGEAEKRAFLTRVADEFGPDLAGLQEAARAFLDAPDSARAGEVFARAEPTRQELIRRLNHAPGGTYALVKMRQTLLAALKEGAPLEALERDFRHLFASWFNRGFLVLKRIEWTTPANILEKIIRYEAVHEISTWDELRSRLDPPDRRLYAFFHPALADEPLIFVEVALTSAIAEAIEPLLASDRVALAPQAATTAVFYSISNAQSGLSGVSFGNFLIKQVVEDLRRELPRLQNFVTLSPVPGFARWLAQEGETSRFVSLEARRTLEAIESGETPEAADRTLSALAAAYFLHARTPAGRVIDPVARFHLGNGARLERINPRGDRSPAGMRQSLGLMVNYRYDPDDIEANHEAFANRGAVTASAAVRKLAAGFAVKG